MFKNTASDGFDFRKVAMEKDKIKVYVTHQMRILAPLFKKS